jgi:hypothetical protein
MPLSKTDESVSVITSKTLCFGRNTLQIIFGISAIHLP